MERLMMKRTRRKIDATLMAKMSLEVVGEQATALRREVHSNQVCVQKMQRRAVAARDRRTIHGVTHFGIADDAACRGLSYQPQPCAT
jgi:hypothetical protein